MTVATDRRMTLQEFLEFEGGDRHCELVNGEILQMSQGTGKHGGITEFLNDAFRAEIGRCGLLWTAKDMKIAVQSPRGTRWGTVRVTDIVVLPLEQWEAMEDREAFIPLNEPPPILVVEVVSPSTVSIDYRAKHSEYAVLDIAEYWIVDPVDLRVTVCTLEDGAYRDRFFVGMEAIVSLTFPGLELTAMQVLRAGRRGDRLE